MQSMPVNNAQDALDFILAGKAKFTLKSSMTGTRYTFKVNQPKDEDNQPKDIWFIQLLTGQDNESDFTYLGMIGSDMKARLTKASKFTEDSLPVKAFFWVYDYLRLNKRMPNNLEFWHEGSCGRCGRTLTVPESIASGFGPECVKHRIMRCI